MFNKVQSRLQTLNIDIDSPPSASLFTFAATRKASFTNASYRGEDSPSNSTSYLHFSEKSPTSPRLSSLKNGNNTAIQKQLMNTIDRVTKNLESENTAKKDVEDINQKLSDDLAKMQNTITSYSRKEKQLEEEISELKREMDHLARTNEDELMQLNDKLMIESNNLREERAERSKISKKYLKLSHEFILLEDEIKGLQSKLAQERNAKERAEESFGNLRSQLTRELSLNKNDWDQTLIEFKNRQRESAMEISQLRQSLTVALDENAKTKERLNHEIQQLQSNNSIISKAENTKYETLLESIKASTTGEIQRLTISLQRAAEDVSSYRLLSSRKDEDLKVINSSLQSVALREAMCLKDIEHLKTKVNHAEEELIKSKLENDKIQLIIKERKIKEEEYQCIIAQCKDEIQTLRNEFSPLIEKYVESITEIKENSEKAKREYYRERESLRQEIATLKEENKTTRRALIDRNEVLQILEKRLASISK